MNEFDVIIIGGGHAGVEAGLAVGRLGKTAAIVTMDASRLALMSCNPAIGGVGKSHVVKEIDALGGVMGEAIDATGIQFRRLNLSRGPAVWSTRAQADRVGYTAFICDHVDRQPNVTVVEGLAGEILVENGRVCGIKTEAGQSIRSHAVIVTTGTFLSGLIHIGEKKIRAGRIGDTAAYDLSKSLAELGLELGRLKTGTPPRLDGETIDWGKCEIQEGEIPIPFFSHRSSRPSFAQTPCHLTYTSPETKRIVSENFKKSPIFSGQINSTGPRYCPSIEDKFYRFADKERHQIFLEPEGNGTSEVYPNGFSTALPEEVQIRAIRTVIGLEKVTVTQPGYAVEYDYCPAYQVKRSLETNILPGLFLAGQILGTSGYEEAAGQGLMAGVNAVLMIDKQPAFVLDRSQSYIGVMIDDITTRSTTEPYRLFTSRAEYRLAMREDNARDRLNRFARQYGLLPDSETSRFEQLERETNEQIKKLGRTRVSISDLGELGVRFQKPESITLEMLLKQPGVSIDEAMPILARFDGEVSANSEVLQRAAVAIRYKGYIAKQQREIDKFKRMESELIPTNFPYSSVGGLKKEASEKLARFRPGSLGQAGRIEGITPGDMAALSIHLKRWSHEQA